MVINSVLALLWDSQEPITRAVHFPQLHKGPDLAGFSALPGRHGFLSVVPVSPDKSLFYLVGQKTLRNSSAHGKGVDTPLDFIHQLHSDPWCHQERSLSNKLSEKNSWSMDGKGLQPFSFYYSAWKHLTCPISVQKLSLNVIVIRVTNLKSKGHFYYFGDRPVTVQRFPHQHHNFTRAADTRKTTETNTACKCMWDVLRGWTFHVNPLLLSHLVFLCRKRVFRLFLFRLFCSVSFFICC